MISIAGNDSTGGSSQIGFIDNSTRCSVNGHDKHIRNVIVFVLPTLTIETSVGVSVNQNISIVVDGNASVSSKVFAVGSSQLGDPDDTSGVLVDLVGLPQQKFRPSQQSFESSWSLSETEGAKATRPDRTEPRTRQRKTMLTKRQGPQKRGVDGCQYLAMLGPELGLMMQLRPEVRIYLVRGTSKPLSGPLWWYSCRSAAHRPVERCCR